ncbi:hypothetical protein ACFODL_18750 [Phenylobacterium terrae]|uniref:Uncharacterized protein n=1 Tax=Phenylobacterium terrae TaxID=2665495 RepID=A0ABW4MZT2_9CAUL
MFLTEYEPPERRRAFASGGVELRLTEAAVMLAFALHLLEQTEGTGTVYIHPDGEHAKIFDISAFLLNLGFERVEALGTTAYGGRYVREDANIIVRPASGLGDVVGVVAGRRVVAECKGGVINSNHAGQKSRLRKGLSELVGQLMLLPLDGSRQVAVLPFTDEVLRIANRLMPRCAAAGLEIALVSAEGRVDFVRSAEDLRAAAPVTAIA